MLTDLNLLLASAEVTPNGGAAPGGLGAASVTLAIDRGNAQSYGTMLSDIASTEFELDLTVTTTFTSSTIPGTTMTVQLVSLPIAPSLLTNATTSGKTLTITGLTATVANPSVVTIANHNLPIGTAIYFSGGSGGTGVATNTIYYIRPTGANTFTLHTTRAGALTNTAGVNHTTTAFTSGVAVFTPFVHASTGPIPLFSMKAGNRFVVRTQPWALTESGEQILASGQTYPQGIGIGSNDSLVPGRYLALQYIPSATITAGALNANLCLQAQNSRRYMPSASKIL